MSHSSKSESEFLKKYDVSQFERPSSSVDVVIFSYFNENLHVLTIKRAEHPFQGSWSLVGGYVDLKNDRNIEETARRKLEEKTGVKSPYLEQLITIGNADRDPRGWSITTVYFALVSFEDAVLKAGYGATDVQWSKVTQNKVGHPLAFDHSQILKLCLERFRNKVLYTSLPGHLMPKEFTIGELQDVYETILGKLVDHKAFRRRILGILEETGKEKEGPTRPAKLYRLKNLKKPHFFMRNMEGNSS